MVGEGNNKRRIILIAWILSIVMLWGMVPYEGFAERKAPDSVPSIETTLENHKTYKGSKLRFDLKARDKDGNKISQDKCLVLLNGKKVKISWEDSFKISYTLNLISGKNKIDITVEHDGRKDNKTYEVKYTPSKDGSIGEAVVDIEVFTLGGDFLVTPTKVKINEGENAAKVLDRVLKKNGFTYTNTGDLNASLYGFYLVSINDGKVADTNLVPINLDKAPTYIKTALNENGFKKGADDDWVRSDKTSLGEFDYTHGSGWMYCVNNVFPNVGFADYYLQDGDVMRVQFTLAYGMDIGGSYAMGGGDFKDFFRVEDKDDLIRIIAKEGIKNVSRDILERAKTLDAGISRKYQKELTTENDVYEWVAEQHCGDPVNLQTGSFYWDYEDTALWGGEPLEFSRHYESQYKDFDYGLGGGWTINDYFLAKVDDSSVEITHGTGEKIIFTKQSDESYKEPVGASYILQKNGEQFKLTHKDGTKYIFNQQGKLTSREKLSRKITYTHDGQGKLQSIGNASGTFTFNWKEGHISNVKDNVGRQLTFEYDEKGHLCKSTNPDGDTLIYSYDEYGHLNSVTDFNGKTYVRNVYDQKGRVLSQEEEGQIPATFEYDDIKHINTMKYEDGTWISIRYDNQGRIVEQSDESGKEKYEYNELHQKVSETDALGHTTLYEYDKDGNIKKATYADGTSECYEYDDRHNLTKYIDALGAVTTYTYDAKGLLTEVCDPKGSIKKMKYDGTGNLIEYIDSLEHTSTFVYDAKGNCTQTIDPEGNKTAFTYDSVGRLETITSADGSTAKYEYTTAGKLIKSTDGLGNTTDYTVNGNGFNTEVTDRTGAKNKVIYDAQNNPSAITDSCGNTEKYTYDVLGNVTSKTDACGNTVNYTYDKAGKLITFTDARGNKITYTYDAAGNLICTDDALGRKAQSTYNEIGLLVEDVKPNNAKTAYTYDAAGRMTDITDALGNKEISGYDANGNLVRSVDKNGNQTVYTYDAENRLIAETNPLGDSITYVYDKVGNQIKVTSALNNSVQTEYDSLNRVVKQINEEGAVIEYVYDKAGNCIQCINGEKGETAYTYDEEGHLLTMTDPEGNTWTYTYDPAGNLISTANPLGEENGFTYDACHRLLSEIDGEGGTVSYTYDENGNRVSKTDALGNIETYKYDACNQLISIKDVRGQISSINYDENGNISWVQDQEGGIISYEYDKLDRLISVTNAEGGQQQYTYDPAGNMLTMTDAMGNVTSYDYDKCNRKIKETDSMGNTSVWEYDGDGRVTKAVAPDGSETSYTYNGCSQVTEVGYNGGEKVNYAYNQNGALVKVTDSKGTTTIERDLLSRIKKVTESNGKNIEYTYDKAGRQTKVKYPDGSENQYTYDKAGRMTSVIEPKGTTAYSYDRGGRLQETHYADGRIESYIYDEANHLKEVTEQDQIKSSYTYDDKGNIIELHEAGEGDLPVRSMKYAYDRKNQMVKAEDILKGQTITYSYDRAGNLTEESDVERPEELINYEYNSLNQMITRTKNGKQERYRYDERGNLIEAASYEGDKQTAKKEYLYNEAGRLVKGINEKGETSSYQYNGLGYLIGRAQTIKTEDGKTQKRSWDTIIDYISSTQNVLWEDNGIQYRYGYGIHPISIELAKGKSDADTWYIHQNYLGNTVYLTNSKGIAESYAGYTQWGEISAYKALMYDGLEIDAVRNYTGHRYDDVLDLYHAKNRMYDPRLHRFIQKDPVQSGENWYTYCDNDPVNKVDPLGLISWAQSGYFILGMVDYGAEELETGAEIAKIIGPGNISKKIEFVQDISSNITGLGKAIKNGELTLSSIQKDFGEGITEALVGDILYVSKYYKRYRCDVKITDKQARELGKRTVGAAVQAASLVAAAKATGQAVGKGLTSLGKSIKIKAPKGNVEQYKKAIEGGICFTGDTLVSTKDGYKQIKEIKVGDEVYSENTETGQKGLKEVRNVFINETRELIHVFAGEEEIRATPTHPFWVEDRGWVAAAGLEAGDKVRLYNGSTTTVEKTIVELLVNPIKVYNFEVEDCHTYFVSGKQILVHNTCMENSAGKAATRLDEIRALIKKGKVKGNNIISRIDDNTQVIFRKDTGVNAHPIRPKYSNAVDHYNVEIQTKTSAGKWKSKESYHIVIDNNGNIIDRF